MGGRGGGSSRPAAAPPAPAPAPAASPAAPASNAGLEQRAEQEITNAYRSLRKEPRGWVGLESLRERLSSTLPRAVVDRVMVQMNTRKGINFNPESNQKALSQRQRDAAVRIGNESKHLISMDIS